MGSETSMGNPQHNRNLGALIDLSQIKDGDRLKEILERFDTLEKNIRYQIKVSFDNKFEELSHKYQDVINLLSDEDNKLDLKYSDTLSDLQEAINTHNTYSESTYAKKNQITLSDLSDELRDKILSIIGEGDGLMVDSKGDVRHIAWVQYFILYGTDHIYLDEIKNKSYSAEKTITAEDWLGSEYLTENYIDNCVELWVYNNTAESYVSRNLAYTPVPPDAEFDASKQYYTAVGNSFIEGQPSSVTWEATKTNYYLFDEALYQNLLIDELESGKNYRKTYVRRVLCSVEDDIATFTEIESEGIINTSIQSSTPFKLVSFNPDISKFVFDRTSMNRTVFKVVKYLD